MNNWDVTELNKLGEFRNGANYPKGSYGKGDKIVNVKDLFKGRFVNYENLDELKFDALSNKTLYLVQHGDLLFTRSSLVKSGAGMVAMINEPHEDVLFCGFIIRFRPDLKKVNPLYLLYLLRSSSYRKLFTDGSVQTNISNINQETLGGINVYLPSLSNQNQIIKILDNLDTKIELNNRINRELEAMAKTLYDYWFVQFDFPNEQGKPYKSSGGKMVYNAELKRKIPEGWEVKKLVQIEPNIITGKTPSTTILENFGGNIPFITIDDIRGQLFILSAERTLSKRGADSQPTKYLKKGDICVSCIGTIGVIGIVNQISQSNQQINTVSINNSYNRYFLLNALKNYFDFNVAAKKGAVLSNMNKAEFSDIPILDSVSSIKEKFNKLVEPIYNKVEINLKQNQQLTELRDWLLPMLMNGQVTVKEAEERLSMAAEPSVEYKKEEKLYENKIRK